MARCGVDTTCSVRVTKQRTSNSPVVMVHQPLSLVLQVQLEPEPWALQLVHLYLLLFPHLGLLPPQPGVLWQCQSITGARD